MANGRLDGPGLVDENVFQTFDRLDKVVINEIKRMNELEAAVRAALGGSAVGSGADKLSESVKKSNTALTEQEKVLREINRLKERNTQVSSDSLRQLAEERTKRSQITKALKDEVVASGKLGRAYSTLRKQRDLAANTLRDMIVSQKSSNREIRNATKEFNSLNNKVKQADKAIGNFRDNVGNYGSAVQGVLGFTRQLAAAFGVYSAIQIGQEIFEQIKALNELKFGLEQVTESQEEFNQAQFFLESVAERAGASLIPLTQRYINFLAAAKSTTLTLKETQRVFENVVVAGAALGRSTEDTNGSLRALEQILSKGNVQAEEIRGQLGERLPGAFQILEKALGLATGELNDMLEVGGLLSVDAIPALSRGLEDAFSLDTIDRVETLAAAQARLGTEFTLFLSDLEGGEGSISRVFTFIFDSMTSIVGLFRELNGGLLENSVAESSLRGVAVATQQVVQESKEYGTTLKETAENILPRYIKIVEEYGEVLQEVTSEQNKSALTNFFNVATGKFDEQQQSAATAAEKIALYQKAIETLNKIVETGKLPEDIEASGAAAEETVGILEALRKKLKQLREDREGATSVAEIQRLNSEIKNTDTEIRRLTDSMKAAKKQTFLAPDSIKFAQKLVKEFTKARDEVNVGSEAWLMYARSVKEAEQALADLEANSKALGDDLSGLASLISDEDVNFADEVDKFLNNEGLDVILGDFADRFKLNKEELLEEYIDIYGRDLSMFEQFEREKLKILKLTEREKVQLRQKTVDLADDLGAAFFEVEVARLDKELEKNNSIFEAVSNNKTASEEQIAAAEKKRDENEARIEKQKQKRENQAFLFRQALSVADIFIADAVARANAVASTAAIVPYLPLGAATLATLQALISTNTAVAIGSVLAQSIPRLFFEGKGLGDMYSGKGIWGELQREVLVDNAGGITVSPDGATPIDVKSTDIIHESMGHFFQSLKSNSATTQRIQRGAKRNSDRNLSILGRRGESSSKFNEEELTKAVARAVAKGLSKAKIQAMFNIQNQSKVTRVP